MKWTAKTLDPMRCALRALKKEIVEFQFEYPLQIVPEANSPDSPHYYLYSDSLSWRALRLDANGIAMAWERTTGTVYWPNYSAWYGMVQLGHYLRRGGEEYRDAFLKQVEKLERSAVVRNDGAVVWPLNFSYPSGPITLKAGWISAYTQGMVISALVRAWRMTKRPALLELLANSAKVFALDVDDSGVRVPMDGYSLYTEVPGGAPPGILDGFMTSLLGLYDLHTATGDPEVRRLFEAGIEGLKYALPRWDYRNKWSWYGCQAYLSPPAYHYQNCLLLEILSGLTGEKLLAEYAHRWNPTKLSGVGRAEIYLGFVVTKNRNRLRYRTWRQKASKTASLNLTASQIPQAALNESNQ